MALSNSTGSFSQSRSGDPLRMRTPQRSYAAGPTADEPPQRSLYDPQFEHDACGVGFAADISGRPSHALLETALQALSNLAHRGAVDADGKTGDGAGVLTQIPHKLLLRELAKNGHNGLTADDLAVGMFFLPRSDAAMARHCQELVSRGLKRHGLLDLGWRDVPVETSALGTKAAETVPLIRQALIARDRVPVDDYERTLYLLRREVEKEAAGVQGFYVPSLSSRTIVYKGLFVASQLRPFYGDLSDPEFETALAVFHQRYSTNTYPNWFLAQPFRMLAHNGEINTLAGNRNWMRAREPDLREPCWGRRIEEVKPVIWPDGSDSASLDNVLELLVQAGRDLPQSMMMLIPEAYEGAHDMDPALRGFYEFAASLSEPWDGPAAVAFADGRFVGAALDRNGLRPARYLVTSDGLVITASEAGAVVVDPERIVEKGRLGPGKMIAVDLQRGALLKDAEIKYERATRRPYAEWVRHRMVFPVKLDERQPPPPQEHPLSVRMKSFGYTLEDLGRILDPMFSEGKEPVGSMGDDTPLSALSTRPRLLYSYFKQRFAQVTNPAIDPLRERSVMSLQTLLGPRGNILEETPQHCTLIKLPSPILTDSQLAWIREKRDHDFGSATLSVLFDLREGEPGMQRALRALVERAAAVVEEGKTILILSDRGVTEDLAPIPMLLAVGAVHHHLIRGGKRMRASLVAESGEAREDHHFACLIGYGAGAVNPYLAFEVVVREAGKQGKDITEALSKYRVAAEAGLLKIMAKMGVATVASYCGAQNFEAVGLDHELIEQYFTGTPSSVGGVGLPGIAHDAFRFHQSAFTGLGQDLEDAGYYRYRARGEYHSFNPAVFRALHKVARKGNGEDYEQFRSEVERRPPMTLRDLLELRGVAPIPLEQVEPAEDIVRRMSTSGMSHGALSREAHETIATALNRIGAKSNSGEGGEDPERYRPRSNGDSPNSRIKQVASARFGVTAQYLVSCDELEIKISQGSKPGEGGQLPGHKVTEEIAAIRHSVPGVTLISPPPHHDIYSIEDLAQLIYDLRQVNPLARIAVKLVSEAGVGTVAAGVAKAHADIVHISGHDGGTGASPLGSIKNAGTPWELGLAESQQVLVMNDLRERVTLRVDGGLKSGRDIVIAAMLGAEEFGFASSAVVALGCVMARQCHLNTCPVGIASQAPHLRRKFTGKPEMVINFFFSVAEEVRQILARLGFERLDQIVGRADLLAEKAETPCPKGGRLDLRPILFRAEAARVRARPAETPASQEPQFTLVDRLLREAIHAVPDATPTVLAYEINNTDRAVGARLAGEIARKYGNRGMPDGTIDITLRGAAGQSFGAFAVSGMRLTLIGEANDYVGKGMAGGEIVIRPPEEVRFDWSENVILGNTVMYGATGGTLYAAGRAGERFCVRNSGGRAVVEGVGDHGCEYMTAGTVVILGEVGRNFAAGMTGGVAYVLDVNGSFPANCNQELVRLDRVQSHDDLQIVKTLVGRHRELTGSRRAYEVLSQWKNYRSLLWKVVTQGAEARRSEPEPEPFQVQVEDGGRALAAAE